MPAAQDSSTDPQVVWPQPRPRPTPPPPPHAVFKAMAVFIAIIMILCALMVIKLFDINNRLQTLNGGNKAAVESGATINNRTP